MIKFFRKIRQRLLNENRFSKYLLYAIGEIVLVVIGILIALQISNWNERNQKKEELLGIYAIIQQDLKKDITSIDRLLKYKNADMPIFEKVFNGTMTVQEYENCDRCIKLIFGYNELAIEQRGINLLKNYSVDLHQNKDSLQILINQFYTNALKILQSDDTIRAEAVSKVVFDWESKYDWYMDYTTDRDYSGFIQYALNNKDYANKVATYYLLQYTIYLPILERYKKGASSIIAKIDKELLEQG
ncbi:DUF6090 family protein [Flagellimonas okinawensis]|uniref:DUF6090 family protein n=1 Tax=Flagellimonas okinawensis TaxID=3031324 RepID=A0ABT5XIW8_9FLAO|nr:DUF6090 family protein [[Muricauda] okinawensis]MDF0705770.1 DUF6090 family protein [[Muricauda] okinawensis]